LGASAVEELLRYESPSQHTIRTAPEDTELGGRTIGAGQSVITMLGAANRDPEHFPEPDRLDLRRQDNRHVAFGWGAHFCFGAPLARLQGRVTFRTLLRRMPRLHMNPDTPLAWRDNLGFRGLSALPVTF
jgi:cytochrome P450